MNRVAARLVAAIWLVLVPGAGTAEPHRCPGSTVRVDADDPKTAARVCAAAQRAVTQLSQCGLRIDMPVHLSVVWPVDPAQPQCLASADCGLHEVRVTDPARLPEAITPDTVLSRVPAAALFDSLIVHELAHVAMPKGLSLPAQEYVAYAMQLDSMPAAARAEILSAYPVEPPIEVERINVFILGFDPMRFATYAWMHFNAPEHGCEFIATLLDGVRVFPSVEP